MVSNSKEGPVTTLPRALFCATPLFKPFWNSHTDPQSIKDQGKYGTQYAFSIISVQIHPAHMRMFSFCPFCLGTQLQILSVLPQIPNSHQAEAEE